MIVVDTNIIGYLFLSSDRSQQAEQALIADPNWAAPLLWRSELRNVLVSYLRKKFLTLADGYRIMNEAMGLMRGREFEVASYQVLSLAEGSACSAYDCEFVALAEDLGVKMVTVDRQILDQFPEIAISLEGFNSKE